MMLTANVMDFSFVPPFSQMKFSQREVILTCKPAPEKDQTSQVGRV